MTLAHDHPHGSPVPNDAPGHWLGFQPQEREIVCAELPVVGRVPGWMAGRLIRNSPVAFRRDAWRADHWFDGLSMLYCFEIRDGKVGFRNRFLDTAEFRVARAGKASFSGAFRLPERSLLQRLRQPFPTVTDNANVSVGRVGGVMAALGEGQHQIEFDEELRTLGRHVYDDIYPKELSLIAHPYRDNDRGELVSLAIDYKRSEVLAYRIADGTNRRQLVARWRSKQLPYIHSFAATPTNLVLIDHPLRTTALRLATDQILARRPFFKSFAWNGNSATRLVVLSRDDGGVSACYDTDPMFVFHTVRAYEEGRTTVVDLLALDVAPDFDELRYDRIERASPAVWPSFTRFRLTPGQPAELEQFDVPRFEFPAVNDGWLPSRPHRFVYGVGPHPTTPTEFANAIFKLDVSHGPVRIRRCDGYVSEPVYVPRHGGREDDGVVLTVMLDPARQCSALIALDAMTLEEIARAEAPVVLPFGFHGRFFSD